MHHGWNAERGRLCPLPLHPLRLESRSVHERNRLLRQASEEH